MTTMKQPSQCNLQPEIQEPHRTTHTDTTTRCKTHRRNNSRTKRPQPHPSHRRGTFHRRLQPTLHGKTHGFVLRLPPQNIAHATFMQPFQCDLHSPSSPLPFLTTSLRHHSPSSPLPFVTTSLRHHFPSSPLPFVTTSLRHHFPSSPLPFVTTSLRHHFPSSPLPFVTTSLRHHFPSSPLPFVTTSLRHHFHSSPPCVIASSLHQGQFHRFYHRHQGQSLCDVLLCNVKSHTTLHQGQFFSDVLLCSVKSHTTLHQSQFFSDVLL